MTEKQPAALPSDHAGLVERLETDIGRLQLSARSDLHTIAADIREAIAALSHAPEAVAVDGIGFVKVRVDTKPNADGWCFCTPPNPPDDVARGLVEGEWNESEQFFGRVLATPPASQPALALKPDAYIDTTGKVSFPEGGRLPELVKALPRPPVGKAVLPLYAAPQPALALIEELEEALERISEHDLKTPGLSYDSVEQLLESAVGYASVALDKIKRFKGE